MFATQMVGSTWMSETVPSVRFPLDFKYSAFGWGHRLETARTKPAPHAPMSLQTWAMILFPAPMGSVASPVINWICMARKFLWPRAGPSQSPKSAPVPTSVDRFDIGEVEVNAVWRDSERIVQQLAD